MMTFSEKELRIMGELQEVNRVKELERKRNWLFALTLVCGLLTLGLLVAMMWNLMLWPDAKYAIGAGLGLTIGITIIELIDHQILAAKLLKKQAQDSVNDDIRKLHELKLNTSAK